MLRAITIGSDTAFTGRLEESLKLSEHFELLRSVREYPNADALESVLCVHAPEVVFLGIDRFADALEIKRHAERVIPGVAIVAFREKADQDTLLELMRAGVRDFLSASSCETQIDSLAARLRETLDQRPPALSSMGRVHSFLPAKPGVGATTIAANLSYFVAEESATKILLADFDLSNGLAAFFLDLNHRYSIADALERHTELDENLWPSLVTKLNRLEVLASPKIPPGWAVEPEQVQHLLSLARRLYHVVCADLSGNVERFALRVLQDSTDILLVCTPELPVLHLARQKIRFFEQLDLAERVRVIVNRWQSNSPMSIREIEQSIGAPVYHSLPNDYSTTRQAQNKGSAVSPHSGFGQAIHELGHQLFGVKAGVPDNGRPTKGRGLVGLGARLRGLA